MHQVATARPQPTRSALHADEDLARNTTARLLITVSTQGGAEALARRIHGASVRASFPLVHTRAIDLPSEPRMLRRLCSRLLDDAAGGTLLISDVDQMAPIVQEWLIELCEELEFCGDSSPAVRLVCCTRVSLLDRIAAGTFSERLFYRLNTVHLME